MAPRADMTTGVMNDRALLCHFLAALAYRTQKALRGAPPAFGVFDPGRGARSPAELIRHMSGVIGYALALCRGQDPRTPDALPTFEAEVARFYATLAALWEALATGATCGPFSDAQLLQGPLADAMTHAGQLALLRRLAGSRIPAEDFLRAEISVANLCEARTTTGAADASRTTRDQEARRARR